MATFFHGGSEIQADGLQTLYLMNPSYVGYSDNQNTTNILFSSPASAPGNALNPANISHAPPPQSQHHYLSTVPIPTAAGADHSMQEFPALHGVIPRFHYNLWGPGEQTSAGSHSGEAAAAATVNMGFRRLPTQQGLSLSLSPQQSVGGYRSSLPSDHDLPVNNPLGVISPRSGDNNVRASGGSPSSVSAVSNGISSMILGSKYLKAVQELLDEVVNVGDAIKPDGMAREKEKMAIEFSPAGKASTSAGETGTKERAELTTAQRQELQMKKAKLVSMLDEVEQRYRHYHHQMQVVVNLFQQAAGLGSARSYTSLALQTISKQFRCLKDAISSQIKATGKSLGEEDTSGSGKVEGSRLKFVDHHLRQQRAMHQLGMMQHNAWRPQRGLPERAVSVLRAWLFEHFLHPYPKDSDKHMLAKQTGLTRSQVSNWFINARVRLWKPMVEEMYLEEIKDKDHQSGGGGGPEKNSNKNQPNKHDAAAAGGSSSNAPPQENNSPSTIQLDHQINNNAFLSNNKQENPTMMSHTMNPSPPAAEISITSTLTTSPTGGAVGFGRLIMSSSLEGMMISSPKKPRNSNNNNNHHHDIQNNSPGSNSILSVDMDMKAAAAAATGNLHSFSELGRFNPEQHLAAAGFHNNGNNGVSLTLGLPHCETTLSNQPTYLSNHNNIQLETSHHFNGINAAVPQISHSNTGFESISLQNRKRFAAQLLPDFVT